MAIDNGYKTYSKASFKEHKHPREAGGTFKPRARTDEDNVAYHYEFDKASHPRTKDGSFISKNASDACKRGYARYGNGTGSGFGGKTS